MESNQNRGREMAQYGQLLPNLWFSWGPIVPRLWAEQPRVYGGPFTHYCKITPGACHFLGPVGRGEDRSEVIFMATMVIVNQTSSAENKVHVYAETEEMLRFVLVNVYQGQFKCLPSLAEQEVDKALASYRQVNLLV